MSLPGQAERQQMSYWGCIRDTSNRDRYPRGTCLKTPEDLQTRCYGHGSRKTLMRKVPQELWVKTHHTRFLVEYHCKKSQVRGMSFAINMSRWENRMRLKRKALKRNHACRRGFFNYK